MVEEAGWKQRQCGRGQAVRLGPGRQSRRGGGAGSELESVVVRVGVGEGPLPLRVPLTGAAVRVCPEPPRLRFGLKFGGTLCLASLMAQ